ncbi:hypothetical protein [Laspinema olomoucense]|uniref:Uncharacterized protein n=1 Tax=Laspinema olomoucense D3b TaxID=2953688 RepID=A0ABT2N0U7_9CYAN|nr:MULTISPECIES: hypothetical protein [unclassified Laspinema]MCT7970894.1 hypothetical protein [Laspinema sp. D3d]MCT7976286.1 hypothetical protein [Laspinema sp. D3b]MCT7990997.1 hypothetical protein [Laspinema sp. D3a]MCT7993840.1 hypothetical protein [Laspinema sp. D3c]
MNSNFMVNLSFRSLLIGLALCLPLVTTTVVRAEEAEETEESSAQEETEESSAQYQFTVTNNTGSPITELYVDDTDETAWGDSILVEPIEPGGKDQFEWADEDWKDGDPCLYDVFTRSEDGTEGMATAIDFCTNPDIEVSPKE